jgi:hypothetical protein
MRRDTRGVIYVACGERYIEAASESARSVRECSPSLATHLFADRTDCLDPIFDDVTLIEDPHRRAKIDCIPRTPFDRTLYLDADTRVVDDISEMFELLDRFDLAIAHAHRRNHPNTATVWNVELPVSFPQLNSGVILFGRNDRTIGLLDSWRDSFHQAGFAKDQVTLRELIWNSDLRVHILPPEYNVRYSKYLDLWDSAEAKPKILHYKEFKSGTPEAEQRGLGRAVARSLARFVRRKVNGH